ncbi:MAG: AhpC/TSA family protein [Bacteroidales bacterium]|nr:AhpC/TSA family protein [Bacteroidales bacterium]
MNKIVLIISLLVIAGSLYAQQYKVSGEIKGLDTNKGYMFVLDEDAPRGFRQDSVEITNGFFEFERETEEPKVITMSFRSDKLLKWVGHGKRRGYIPTKSALLMFIAAPGTHVKISGEATDFCNAYPSGDRENDLLAELNRSVYSLMNEMVNLSRELQMDTTMTDSQKEEKGKKAEALYKQTIDNKIAFLEKHASSVAGLWLMEDMLLRSQIEIEKVDELMATVDAHKYGNYADYKKVAGRIKGYKETGVGMIAPAITGVNLMDDKEFKLESMRGKYVLIDFWGTWCGACLAGTPEMKKFRDKHADKLQIVGLAKDRNVEQVKKCMADNGMDWPNMLIGKGEQDYVAKYNVQGYPTKILLDRNGKILLRSVGESEEFYQEVEKLMR